MIHKADVENYDSNKTYSTTPEQGEEVVGHVGVLHLTGRFTDSGTTSAGVWVRFEVDERWGFEPGTAFTMDLACFDVHEDVVA